MDLIDQTIVTAFIALWIHSIHSYTAKVCIPCSFLLC